MRPALRQILTKKLQKVFWVYLTNNFIVGEMSDVKMVEPVVDCAFVPITADNYFRVRDFREEGRISEYRDKLAHKERGFFAESDGKIVGSIWATINYARVPTVARTHVKLMPNEALIHDIVTGEKFRGMGVGPFMVGRIASTLLNEFGVSRIIIDVNVKNSSSMRMMNKAGVQVGLRVLSISAFGKLAFEKVLKNCV